MAVFDKHQGVIKVLGTGVFLYVLLLIVIAIVGILVNIIL